ASRRGAGRRSRRCRWSARAPGRRPASPGSGSPSGPQQPSRQRGSRRARVRERGFLGLSSGKGSRAAEDRDPSRGLACSIRAAMKIAVCAKYVPDAAAHLRLDPETKRLDRSGEGALNPFDINAVEEALRLKEAAGDGEIVIVSVGPEGALEAMRKALAMGADRVVLVSDEGAAGSDLV